MKMKKETIYVLLVLDMLFIYGCSPVTETGGTETAAGSEEIEMTTIALTQLAGTSSPYYRFDKAHFENSLQQGKTIFLDFHAD